MNLLTIDDIANMVKLSRSYVRDKLVKRASFPRPSLSLSQKLRRWNRSDIEQWLANNSANISR